MVCNHSFLIHTLQNIRGVIFVRLVTASIVEDVLANEIRFCVKSLRVI